MFFFSATLFCDRTMFLVGLTGGISTGKSTVARFFSDAGVIVIDADDIARQIVNPGCNVWHRIRDEFGDDILDDDGLIDRERLGQIIFHSAERRRALNRITHPEIRKQIAWQIFVSFLAFRQFVVVDLPLLFEAGTFVSLFHTIVVVACREDIQLDRLMERDGLSFEEARARLGAQMPLTEKVARADEVVCNDGDLEETREQVERILQLLRSSWAHWKIRLVLFSTLTSIIAIFVGLFAKLSFG